MNDRSATFVIPASALILAAGIVAGGYLLGDGLLRARDADRSVTVRGLAERDVQADLATWVMGYSATGARLEAVQADIAGDTAAIQNYFAGLDGPHELEPSGVSVSSFTDGQGRPTVTVRQRMTFRTRDMDLARRAVARQFELIGRGVVLEDGAMSYSFTGLDAVKPAMVADATRDARRAAQQFAEDSGTRVGAIRSATQGYFSIQARDGESGGYGVADTPDKKVRVVTTVTFALED